MPRKAVIVDQTVLTLLKKRILAKSDMQLNRSVDCDILARMVSEQTRSYINGITFKRLYGFTKYQFNPSIQTLDILCQFLGFKNWYEFEIYLNDRNPISQKELDIYLTIFDIDLINDVAIHEGAFQSVSRKIAQRFRQDPNTLIQHINELVEKPFAQIFFVEHFPDYDNLCLYYHKVFEVYLTYKKTKEATIFGNAMLFLYSFWKQEQDACSNLINKIRNLELDDTIHPYVKGRYYACNFLFETFFNQGKLIEKYYHDYLKRRKLIPKNGKHFYDFPASEYIVSEALLHCKQYEKAMDVIDLAKNDYSLRMEFVRKGYYRQLQLIWLLSNKKLHSNFQIDSYLQKIKPDDFYFISQKYFSVIYLKALGTRSALNEAKELAMEMGNLYLLNVFFKE